MNFRSLASNMLTAFLAQGISFLASIAMSLLVPKVLGVTAYGYWQLFVFYATYSGFFMLGLNDGIYLVEGGRTRQEIDKKSINSQFVVEAVFLLVLGTIIALASVAIAPGPERAFVLLSFSIYMILSNLAGYLGYVFQAMNETKLFSYATILERLFFLVCAVILVCLRVPDFRLYVIAYTFSKACALTYCCLHARDFFTSGLLKPSTTIRLCIASIKVGIALMISNVADMLILGFARILVDSAWGIEAFGRVSFSLSMVNFFITFVSQASMVLFPALRQGTDTERESFYRGIRDAMEIILPLAYLLYYPVAILLALWLPQYTNSMHYFAILMPVCVFNTKMNLCGTTYFKVLRLERLLLKVNIITVLSSLVLCLFGIYIIQSLDAVLVGAIASIIGRSLFAELYLNQKLNARFSPISIEEIALTIIFLALTLHTPGWTAAIVYAATYVIYILINRTTTHDLIQMTRRILSKSSTSKSATTFQEKSNS